MFNLIVCVLGIVIMAAMLIGLLLAWAFMDYTVRWVFTSKFWFARWLSNGERISERNSRIPLEVQEIIDKAEYDAVINRINPEPEYEKAYNILMGKK